MHKIIVSNRIFHEDLKHVLLSEQNYYLGVAVRDFKLAFFESDTHRRSMEISVFNQLQTCNCPRLQEVLKYPKTMHVLIDLLQELYLYGLSLDACPRETPLQEEIFQCLSLIDPYLEKPVVREDVAYEAVAYGLSHAEYTFLTRHNIPFIEAQSQKPESIAFKVALNPRSELEAVVQDIIRNGYKSATIAVANKSMMEPLIESIFERYGYPLKLQDRRFDLMKSQYRALLDFAFAPNIDQLIKAIESGAFGLKRREDIVTYLTHFEFELNDVFGVYDLCEETESYPDLFALQSRIQEDVVRLKEYLGAIMNLDFKETLIACYNVIKSHTHGDLTPLCSLLEKHLGEYQEETYLLMLEHLDSLQAHQQIVSPLRIVDYCSLPLIPQDHLYVVNLSAKNFPSIRSRTGIIDEAYLSCIEGYPRLDERTQFTLKMQNHIFDHNANMTLSYSSATYEGKGQEVSYPVEQFARENNAALESWILTQNTYRKSIKHRLSPSLAKELYLEDGKLIGSISAFQMFVNDPYQFFMERGLKIREPEILKFDPRIIGTVNHAVMEYYHDKKNIDPWTDVRKVFPMTHPRYRMIYDRNQDLMKQNLDFVDASMADTSFQVVSKERWFREETMFNGIVLRGIIDRIDENDHYVQVIDYKSSQLAMTAENVKAGTQLQLLTYAMIAEKAFQKKCLAVYYYGFKNPNLTTTALEYKVAKGVISKDIDFEAEWLKAKRYKGWLFEQPLDSYDSATYFGGLRESKDGVITAWTKPYDMNKIKPLLTQIYQTIYSDVMNGVLDPEDSSIEIDKDLDLKKDDEEIKHDDI